LKDVDDRVREHAVKLSEKLLNKGVSSDALWAALREKAADPSLFVVYQLAFTLGEIQRPERINILAECVARDLPSSWMQAAVLSSLATGAGQMFTNVTNHPKFAGEPAQKFISQLISVIGTRKDPNEVAAVLNYVSTSSDPTGSFMVLRSLNDGLQRAGGSLAQIAPAGSLDAIFARANQVAVQASLAIAVRTQAIQLLASDTYNNAAITLLALLNQDQPQEIQLVALTTLGKFNEPKVASELIQRWNSLTPRLRTEAISILVARPDRALALLQAIQLNDIRATELTTPQTKFLRTHRDPVVRAKATGILGAATASKRQEVVDAFNSALTLKGDAAHGRAIYLERCVSCHRLEGQGFALGPDLVTVQNSGKEKMLLNILDPNREVAPQFQAYEVEMKDGESVIGLIASESATSVIVKQAYGKEDTILRSGIKKMHSQQQSLMPEGLEAGLKPQDMADLLEYVSTAK
jgi:putative heme-binding domain-containing protein